jgi:hypothetical protein
MGPVTVSFRVPDQGLNQSFQFRDLFSVFYVIALSRLLTLSGFQCMGSYSGLSIHGPPRAEDYCTVYMYRVDSGFLDQ